MESSSAPRRNERDALSDAQGTTGGIATESGESLSEQADDIEQAQRRRQVGHDIRHELSTIMLLASVISSAQDAGPDSRVRAEQILGEARWLDELLRAYEGFAGKHGDRTFTSMPVRLDVLAADVVRPIRLSCSTRVSLDAREVWAHVDRLAFWRAVRNIVCNALQAAGPDGTVAVCVSSIDGYAVVDVDDDGPGFDVGQSTTTSLGLGIVAELVSSWHGELEIRRGSLGGCRVRLRLPVALTGYAADVYGAGCAS